MNPQSFPPANNPPPTIAPISMQAPNVPPEHRSGKRRASTYHMYDDIEEMMYGFGDNWPPNSQSVELMEKLVANYIRSLCHKAQEVSDISGGKLDKECFMYVVRKDRRKFTRAYGLLKANEELKRVQKYEMKEKDKEDGDQP